jgi:hypothetical protein
MLRIANGQGARRVFLGSMNTTAVNAATPGNGRPPRGVSRDDGRFTGRPFDYLLMTVILWTSGNPLIDRTPLMRPFVAGLAFLLLAIVLARKLKVSRRDLWIMGSFGAIVAIQAASSGFIGLLSVMGFFAKLVTAFAAVRLMRNFARVYVDAMFWTAMISFPFFALMIATQGRIAGMLAPFTIKLPDPYFLVHFFAFGHPTQNNSYFWEPGVFAGYLVVAIACLGAVRDQYSFRRYRFILIVLLAAVATTQSTGGYLTAPLALIFHGKAFGRNLAFRAVLVVAAVVGSIFLFKSADFLGNKISKQYHAVEGQENSWQLTRLGSMIYDFRLIRERPLFGWGPDPEAQSGVVDQRVTSHEGNGLSSFMASFGIFGLALFMVTAWIGFLRLFNGKGRLAALALFIVVAMLNDECFLTFPLFMSLMFLRRPAQSLAGSPDAVKYAPNAARSVRGLPPPAVAGPLSPTV